MPNDNPYGSPPGALINLFQPIRPSHHQRDPAPQFGESPLGCLYSVASPIQSLSILATWVTVS